MCLIVLTLQVWGYWDCVPSARDRFRNLLTIREIRYNGYPISFEQLASEKSLQRRFDDAFCIQAAVFAEFGHGAVLYEAVGEP